MARNKKSILGKGLNELLSISLDPDIAEAVVDEPQAPLHNPDTNVLQPTVTSPSVPSNRPGLNTLPINQIVPSPYQPRREFDNEALEQLANSIKVHGILQPIVVRRGEGDNYELVAGERRLRAARLAGLDNIPAIVKNINNESALAIALIENIQRENLNPLEEALAVERLIDEFNLTHQEAAEVVGKSRATITNLLRLLTLNEDVKMLIERGEIEAGHAKVLLSLTGKAQSEVAKIVVAKGLSVRDTEILVSRVRNKTATKAVSPALDPNVARLQVDLSEKLGTKVVIKGTPKGKGYLVISYNSLEELDGIIEHIQ